MLKKETRANGLAFWINRMSKRLPLEATSLD
jgi:hypothetical protein